MLVGALQGVVDGGITLPSLVEKTVDATGAERTRVTGLAGWLPLSRVAHWNPESGLLELEGSTDLNDLAMRFVAWVGSQAVPVDHVPQVEEYVRAILEEAMAAAHALKLPPLAPTDSSSPKGIAIASITPPAVEEEPAVSPALTKRLMRLLDALDEAFLERSHHVRASLLALLSEQHVLLLGPPGTAKSMLARAMCAAFEDATYFEYLLSRFTTPDELFGPVSIPGLKEEDYRRLTEGFLPAAHVAFLDEIFKANSAILNSLLTLINERVFHHGRHRDQVPLVGMIGASNELPDPDGGLAALYDRFLVRLTVPPLGHPHNFLSVATGNVPDFVVPEGTKLNAADREELLAGAAQVVVPPTVEDSLVALWRVATRSEWEVSDRRWRQAISMLKVGTAAAGRRTMAPLDLLLLEPVLTPSPDRAAEVRDAILDQLGTGIIPQHDLRAQWILLRQDRVAPAAGVDPSPPPPAKSSWKARITRRRASIKRFLVHHQEAVQNLADDRARLERQADSHPWIHSLPITVLSAHIEGARDLARLLKVAETYASQLNQPMAIAAALVESLPERSRRVYGHDVACNLDVAGKRVGLTLAGERVPVEATAAKTTRTGAWMSGDQLILSLEPISFLDWVEGGRETRELVSDAPAWASRNAVTALESARRLLGGQVVPPPPELPQP